MNDMNEPLTPIQEQALDALLSEVHGQSVPPDLTNEILASLSKLPQRSALPAGIVCADDSLTRRSVARPAPLGKPVAIATALITVLAASLLVAVVVKHNRQTGEDDSLQVATLQRGEISHQLSPDSGSSGEAPKEVASGPRRLNTEEVPLAVDTPDAASESEGGSLPGESPRSASRTEIATLVSASAAADLTDYWNAIGIVPTPEANRDETIRRLAVALGVKLPAKSLADPELIQLELGRPRIARSIAGQWLQQITQGGLARLKPEAQERLIGEVAQSIRSRSRLDGVLANWISGDSPNMPAFYTAVSSGGEDQMVRRLASLTMNVDLRCVQCHDALIEGSGRQEDYWSFAAFLRKGLAHKGSAWKIQTSAAPSPPLFYALPDGRQRVAEPGIAGRWLRQQKPITNISEWSNELVSSPELASGIVNSLWELVHGQPLQGRVVDTITAPHHESLDRLEQRLADDLVESRFDVGRTLALIIASPATFRTVPQALLAENNLASATDLHAAMQSVNAFAATVPPSSGLPLVQRIDVAMQRIGARIDGANGKSVLAQGSGESSNAGKASAGTGKAAANVRPKKGSDFPGRATSLPVQWLAAIDDQESRAKHLGYLAGMSKVPKSVIDAARLIREASDDDELALNRVWWLVRP